MGRDADTQTPTPQEEGGASRHRRIGSQTRGEARHEKPQSQASCNYVGCSNPDLPTSMPCIYINFIKFFARTAAKNRLLAAVTRRDAIMQGGGHASHPPHSVLVNPILQVASCCLQQRLKAETRRATPM